MDGIPHSLACKKGVVKQLQEVSAEVSSTALDILGLASAHQARASDPRLGVIRGSAVNLNSNLVKAHAAKKASSSLGVGQSLILERAAKKKDAKMKSNVRIDARLFQLRNTKPKGKKMNADRTMSEVSCSPVLLTICCKCSQFAGLLQDLPSLCLRSIRHRNPNSRSLATSPVKGKRTLRKGSPRSPAT
jgi:hypothetical protein